MMARAIAQQAAEHGVKVWIFARNPASLYNLPETVNPVQDIQELAQADLIIEAVAEKSAVKQAVFQQLIPFLNGRQILATNTSSITVTSLAAAVNNPENFCGIHFMHPLLNSPLVEIIPGVQTSPETITRAENFVKQIGLLPLIVKDGPGFVVNRILFPYISQSLQLLLEGVAPEAIEQAAVESGMRFGPLALADLIGLDVLLNIGWEFSRAFGDRVPYSPILVRLVKAGRLGIKTDKGIFNYANSLKPFIDDEVRAIIASYSQPDGVVDAQTLSTRLFTPVLEESIRVREEFGYPEGVISTALQSSLGFPQDIPALVAIQDHGESGVDEVTAHAQIAGLSWREADEQEAAEAKGFLEILRREAQKQELDFALGHGISYPREVKVNLRVTDGDFSAGGHADRETKGNKLTEITLYIRSGNGFVFSLAHEVGAALGLPHQVNERTANLLKKFYGKLPREKSLVIFHSEISNQLRMLQLKYDDAGNLVVRDPSEGAVSERRVYSFGLFVADMIYKQNAGQQFPDQFRGITREQGDNAMTFVPAEWISEAVPALEANGAVIDTNFGGPATATSCIGATLGVDFALVAPCADDKAGQADLAYLKKIGVDTAFMPVLRGQVSASNLIRNLETGKNPQGEPIYAKDYALYLAPLEGFPYSKSPALDSVQAGDIVHLGGMDLIICPKGTTSEEKNAKYQKAIDEMVGVTEKAVARGAYVVADFCMGDPEFWKMVPDSFFSQVAVVKPSIAQAIAIYNSRHAEKINLDTSDPQKLLQKQMPQLLEILNFLLDLGFNAVFMTLDVGGTIIAAKPDSVFGEVKPQAFPIIPAREFKDGTGCGDAFVAGIIKGMVEGWSMQRTAWFSTAVGSLIAERAGVSLEEQYIGKGKWLPVVEERLSQANQVTLVLTHPYCLQEKQYLALLRMQREEGRNVSQRFALTADANVPDLLKDESFDSVQSSVGELPADFPVSASAVFAGGNITCCLATSIWQFAEQAFSRLGVNTFTAELYTHAIWAQVSEEIIEAAEAPRTDQLYCMREKCVGSLEELLLLAARLGRNIDGFVAQLIGKSFIRPLIDDNYKQYNIQIFIDGRPLMPIVRGEKTLVLKISRASLYLHGADKPAISAPTLTEFSCRTREDMIETVSSDTMPLDVVVIGGGATGTAIARDAAIRGLRTALLEKTDFAAGTSSGSSELIQGGIKNMLQH
ncbi:MAG: PfkB family carbohydrate kinase [Candidatus Omnitrophica bacterium]|nr:PfkB family carbohydrate kinase [Candidatus Omnitrophota bacterium]